MTNFMTTAVLAVEGATEAEEGPSPLMPHIPELILSLVVFAVLFLVLRRFVFPVFERLHRERREAIEGGMSRATAAQAEADSLLAQYRAQLQEARTEASRIRTDAQSERASIVEAARLEAREVAQAEADRSRQQITAELATARAELSRDIGRMAVDLAGQIVGENLADRDATRRTVDRFLEGLDDLAPAGSSSGRAS